MRVFLLKAVGKLTHEDYQLIVPMVDDATRGVKNAQLDVLADCSDLEGWELRAAWDDFKLGLKHGKEFRRVAIVGNKKWMEVAAKVGDWFVSGDVKCFVSSNEAMAWIKSQ
ncbi:STAS/SEC14 domain-containing protein [Oceanicoccus sp. KOV_DT_Chl]|uniref:STAS/SEC14 domain-containing protein n=1 Tax=Oceanicoccus sp. KOV_DT_Chl TaxID=1904639 RepID=UPI001F353763|nr:STAS/SEC14 domain-containing protein [Oceanicoccus sp. KOV_DT_Chl]